jgi:hypothetical protein
MGKTVYDEIEEERYDQVLKNHPPEHDAINHLYRALSDEAARILRDETQVICRDYRHKPFRERLVIAAALIVAEIERYDFMVEEGIDQDVRGEVELNFAYSWICPECGAKNFDEPKETTQEQIRTRQIAEGIEIPEGDRLMEQPTRVCCSACHVSFDCHFVPTPEAPDA